MSHVDGILGLLNCFLHFVVDFLIVRLAHAPENALLKAFIQFRLALAQLEAEFTGFCQHLLQMFFSELQLTCDVLLFAAPPKKS
jgi:hypothetical protein